MFLMCIFTDVLQPTISSSVIATSATLSFSQPTNRLSVNIYTVTLNTLHNYYIILTPSSVQVLLIFDIPR